jgi:hypothetical protein
MFRFLAYMRLHTAAIAAPRSRDILRKPPEGKSVIWLSSPFCKKILVFI